MKDEEILKVLEEFSDFLQIGDIVNYVFRWIGWFLILGVSWIVDALEDVTDAVLGIKLFFNSPQIQEFLKMLYPVFVVLLSISFLYIGYMFIMNKKMNRSQIVVNIFITMCVLTLLGTGMTKVDKFTDDAIAVVKSEQKGSISDEIIKKNIIDIALIDSKGWKEKENLNPKNNIPEKNIRNIDITEKIDEDFEFAKDKDLSENGQKILKNKRVMDGLGVASLAELQDGWFDFFPEKYYRWHWNFWSMFITLLVTGVTMLLVSIKLARLFYELTFNYLLANILAPVDIANGQKLKQVLTNILNIFVVTIMIFLSLKLYMLGTAFIHDKLDGVPYLIALAAFSMAVLDGPVIVERLFGIDIGLKSSWAMLAGGVALGKGIGSAANSKPMKGLANMLGKGAAGAAQGAGGAAAKTASAAAMATGGAAGILNGLRKGNEDGNKESLQDQMKKAEQKKAQGNGLGNKEKDKLNNKEDKKNGANPSVQEQMKKEGNGKPEGTSNQETGTTSLQDEMKDAGIASEGSLVSTGSVNEGGGEESSTQTGTAGQGGSEGSSVPTGTVREGGSEGIPAATGTVSQGASEGSSVPAGTVREEGNERIPAATGTVSQGASEGSSVPAGTVREGGNERIPVAAGTASQGGNEGIPAATGTVSQGASEGSSVPAGTVREGGNERIPVAAGTASQGGNEGIPAATGTVSQGASEGSSVPAGTVREEGNERIPVAAGTASQGGSEGMPVAVGTVRQGTSEGSSTPVESYGPVASGSSPAPVEQSRPVVNEGSSTPVESYRPVVSESSPAPAEMVTVTHGSPRGTYEVDKEVAASTSDIPMPANRETRTLGQYATDKIKGSVTSTKTSIKQTATEVKEKITNSHTVKNTKRFYQMGENTGKSWRDIVSKNNKKEK